MARSLLPAQTCRIRVLDVASGEVTTVFSSDSLLVEAPNWSPDGLKIVYMPGGTGIRTMNADGTGKTVVSATGSLFVADATATGARLSADGRYLLTSEITSSSSVPDEVVEVASGKRVVLPVPDDGRVVDVAFGPDDTLTLALSRPGGARFPATVPRGDGAQPGFDVVTCRLREGTCQVAAQLDNVGRAPLLAH